MTRRFRHPYPRVFPSLTTTRAPSTREKDREQSRSLIGYLPFLPLSFYDKFPPSSHLPFYIRPLFSQIFYAASIAAPSLLTPPPLVEPGRDPFSLMVKVFPPLFPTLPFLLFFRVMVLRPLENLLPFDDISYVVFIQNGFSLILLRFSDLPFMDGFLTLPSFKCPPFCILLSA